MASEQPRRKQREKHESLGGAVVRSLFGTLAFVFKRPVRLFRPVKLSSWTILEAMAKREGNKGLSLRYLRSLLRRENASFLPHLLLPPLLFNTAIGFTLFEAYSITESRLLHHAQHQWTPLWIVTVSGAVAGAAQCFLSAPLDNVRYIMQQNVSPGRKRHKRISTISWRAILRAAILPFAPAVARDKLVKAVHHETIKSSTAPSRVRTVLFGEASRGLGLSPEKRQEWEKRLKRWRGGIHGSGLALSLIRDSVGFGSFFCLFEVSRRCAFYASTTVDKISVYFNGRGLGVALPSRADGDADVSYNQSRTVQGRIVAVVILLVGGAVGALSYELVGRPFELMRVVIWEGRKQWEQGKREPEAPASKPRAAPTRTRHVARKRAPLVAKPRAARQGRKRAPKLVRRSKPAHPTLATRPGALTLLLEHAQSTLKLDRKYGAPDAGQMSKPALLAHTYFLAPFLPELPKLVLDNPVVRNAAGVNKRLQRTGPAEKPAPTTVAQRTLHMSLASRRRAVAESPEDKVKRSWVRNNPVNSSLAYAKQGNSSILQHGTRYWASGRVTWALKRLATPYGVAFLVFAWLGGDLN